MILGDNDFEYIIPNNYYNKEQLIKLQKAIEEYLKKLILQK